MPKDHTECSMRLFSRSLQGFGTVDHMAAPHGQRPEGGRQPLGPEGPFEPYRLNFLFFFYANLSPVGEIAVCQAPSSESAKSAPDGTSKKLSECPFGATCTRARILNAEKLISKYVHHMSPFCQGECAWTSSQARRESRAASARSQLTKPERTMP